MTPELKQRLEAYAKCENLTTNLRVIDLEALAKRAKLPCLSSSEENWDTFYTGKFRADSVVEYAGFSRTIAEWAEIAGVSPPAMVSRLRRNPIGIALTMQGKPHKKR